MMKQYKQIPLGMTLLLSTLFGACSHDESVLGGQDSDHPSDDLIVFDAKGDNVTAGTRAADQGEITYLEAGTHFSLRMYYDSRNEWKDNTGKEIPTVFDIIDYACMEVSEQPNMKRCIYTDNYAEVTLDANGIDDKKANKFYWNNRKYHGFVGFFLNNDPKGKPSLVDEDSQTDKNTLVYSLEYQKNKDGNWYQDDPMLAVKRQQPTSGNNIANRVYLLFEHQTACVVVNVNTDKVSVEPIPENGEASDKYSEKAVVSKISLLGTARFITVFTKMDNEGNIVNENNVVVTDSIGPKDDEKKHVCYSLPIPRDTMPELVLNPLYSKYKENGEENAEDLPNIKPGYNATASGLAFGELQGLGIEWQEVRPASNGEGLETVTHTINYPFMDNQKPKFQKLLSGKKYIYNVTLRRGTIATIRLEIVDWKDDEAPDYSSDGIIDRTQSSSNSDSTGTDQETGNENTDTDVKNPDTTNPETNPETEVTPEGDSNN